jgi:putative membrane protein
MKRISYFTGALLQVTFVAIILLLASCSNNQKPEDAKDVAEENNDERFENNKQENDAQFLVNAAEINMVEIQLAQLAQQIGRTTHVKELGKMMEDAHTKSLNDLTALAQSKMISIPTSPTDDGLDAYKTLNEKAGDDFDKAYADMMVSEHKEAIEAFEKAATNSNDTDIKNWATVSLPGLRTHLEQSIECQKKLDK